MSEVERVPPRGSETAPPAFDPERLDVYLDGIPADGIVQIRTLLCAALACGLALVAVPIETHTVAVGTVTAHLREGSRVTIGSTADRSPASYASSRLSAVAHGLREAPGPTATLHILLDGEAPARTGALATPEGRFEAGQRVLVRIDSGRRSLWKLLSAGVGASPARMSSPAPQSVLRNRG